MATNYQCEFTDALNGNTCALILLNGIEPFVRHPGCDAYADVSLHLDAFYCVECHYNGRVSGAWVQEVMEYPCTRDRTVQPDAHRNLL